MPAASSSKSYRVGRSRTGLGLFATQPIKKGTEIIHYVGPLLDSRIKEDDAVENKYLFRINGRWTVDGSVRSNVARYINHACRPNAESSINERKRSIVIRAIKNIAEGEEINYDYGKEYFKSYLKPIGCKCDFCEKKRAKEQAEAAGAKPAKAEKKSATKTVKAKAGKSGKAESEAAATKADKKSVKTKVKAKVKSKDKNKAKDKKKTKRKDAKK